MTPLHKRLAPLIQERLSLTQDALECATIAAGVAQTLLDQGSPAAKQPGRALQQHQQKAAEAAVASAEQALVLAVQRLQETQRLVLLQQGHRMLLQQQMDAYMQEPQQQDPDLEDTCDSSCTNSISQTFVMQ